MSFINRPWLITFKSAVATTKNQINSPARALDQVHKLVRNFAVSIDIGGASIRHVPVIDSAAGHPLNITALSGKERYLIWVKRWKVFYRELSDFIRWCKQQVKQKIMDASELLRLKESAQVMLNARRLGKLASWAIVQRNQRLNTGCSGALTWITSNSGTR